MFIFQFVEEMSKRMNFDYELVLPTSCAGSECYGRKREDGSWSGVMGKYRVVQCYCINLIDFLKIWYSNSIPTKNSCYLPGDLVNGEVDIAVAGMTMTSEREEVKPW